MRHLIACELRAEGYQVIEAADGIELLALIRSTVWGPTEEQFEAIVSDINMPDLTAVEILSSIRCRLWAPPPVVLITAFDNAERHVEAETSGVIDILQKPLDMDRLRRVLRAVCSGRRDA